MQDKVNLLVVEEEGVEEFRVSLLLHFALLIFLSAWFAVRGGSPSSTIPKIFQVKLIGSVELPKLGSGPTMQPNTGSRQGPGIPRPLSKGKTGPKHPFSNAKKAIHSIPKGKTQKPRADLPIGGQEKPGEFGTRDQIPNHPGAPVSRDEMLPPKPYIAAIGENEVSPFSPEPSGGKPIESALAGGDLGEPIPVTTPSDEPSGPVKSGTGIQAAPPSGSPDVKEGTGAGTMEIGGIESLGGGTESFERPRIISRVMPDYPEWARQKGIKGQALYKVLIQESGTVGDVINMASTIDPKLAIIGSQALRRWVFSPVMVGGEPQETWVRITVQFSLN